MNSVTLATTTNRKMGEMSDGTGTQVKVQLINKCKVLMTSRELYKRRESHEEGDREKKEKRRAKPLNRDKDTRHISPRTILDKLVGDLPVFNCYIAEG